MALTTIVAGDDLQIPATLYKNGNVFNIDTGATIQASIISLDHSTVLAGPVTIVSTNTGNDWPNSLVVAEFPSAQTTSLPEGGAKLEIQVNAGGKSTWFSSLKVVVGTIA